MKIDNPQNIPQSVNIGGDDIQLYHKNNIVCASCNATGHSTAACIKITAKRALLEKQTQRRHDRMELEWEGQ